MVEGVGAAAARVEQHPEPAALVLGPPADVVEHHGAGQPLRLEEALHQLHRHEVALVGLGAGDDDVAVPLGPGVRVQQPLAEVARRQEVQQAELVLPAQAVGLELVEQVEHGQVAAELLARRVRR